MALNHCRVRADGCTGASTTCACMCLRCVFVPWRQLGLGLLLAGCGGAVTVERDAEPGGDAALDASADVVEASKDAPAVDAAKDASACPPRAGDPCEIGQMWCDPSDDGFVWICNFGMWESQPCGAPIALCTRVDGGPYVCRGSFCK